MCSLEVASPTSSHPTRVRVRARVAVHPPMSVARAPARSMTPEVEAGRCAGGGRVVARAELLLLLLLLLLSLCCAEVGAGRCAGGGRVVAGARAM